MLVRALRMGWYGKRRIRPGVEFEIEPHELGQWMERVNKPGRKKTTQSTEDGEKSPLSNAAINVSRVKASYPRLGQAL